MSAFLVAVVGGSVGALLLALGRGASIPIETRTHDEAVAERDEQLGTWIADTNYELLRASTAIRDKALQQKPDDDADPDDVYTRQDQVFWNTAARAADEEIVELRRLALHAYRDEERRAKQDRARILAVEGWAHGAYRRFRRHPIPALTTPERASVVLDWWRQQSNLSTADKPLWPDDATKRTLEDAIARVRGNGP